MAEYMERVQKEADENGDGAPEQVMVHREYECSYSGSTRGIGEGYGHAELHLSVSPTADAAGRRTISGCGMREWEYMCAGNDFGEYEHAVSGAWGTGFISTDFSDADE